MTLRHVTDAQAGIIVAAAKAKADAIGVAATIVVQDHGGHPVALSRMDGAFLGSIDLAERKARTSAFFRRATEEVWEVSKPGGEAHGIELSNGLLITFPGGLPIVVEGKLVGSVGVSGGTAAQDREIAAAGLEALAAAPAAI